MCPKLTIEEKINHFKTLPEYVSNRLEQINNRINETDNIQMHTIFQIGLAMNQYFESLAELLESRNISAANIMFRSLIESSINIEYILQDDSQKRSVAFIFDDFKIQRINVNTIKGLIQKGRKDPEIDPRLSTKEKCNKQLERIKKDRETILTNLKGDFGIEIEEKDLEIPPVEVRANKAGLKDIYDILYRTLCQVTHLSSSGLKQLIKFDGNKYKVVKTDPEEEINRIIPIAYGIY